MDNFRQQRNQFGLLSNDYAKFRRGYPDEVFEIIKNKIKNNKTALDVGCGTGIATKEIAKFCESVIGTDKEEGMLEQARIYAPNCKFILAPAEKLPFEDSSFDLLVVAQAFHWFDQQKALSEFKRVIKPDGLIVIFRKCSKDGQKILPRFVWDVLSNYFYLDEDLKNQDEFSYLNNADLKSCELIELDYVDVYIPEEYLGFLRTHSTYNLIPDNKKASYINEITEVLKNYLQDGTYSFHGKIEIWCLQK